MWFVQFSRHSQEETLLPSRWSNIITRIPNLTHSKTIFLYFSSGEKTHTKPSHFPISLQAPVHQNQPLSPIKRRREKKKCNRIPPHNQRKREKTKRQKWSLSAAVKGHKKSWWTPALEALMGLPRPLPLSLSLSRALTAPAPASPSSKLWYLWSYCWARFIIERATQLGEITAGVLWRDVLLREQLQELRERFFWSFFHFFFVGDSGRGDI